MILMNAVLVATDFGETSNAALVYGRNLARTFGARLHVLHVVQKMPAAAGDELFAGDLDVLQADVVDRATAHLEKSLTDNDLTMLQATPALRIATDPAQA